MEHDATEEETVGPAKGDFVVSADAADDADQLLEALPDQEAFWRPPVRFGSIPVEKEPLGWDRRRGFRKLFPVVMLPTQVVDVIDVADQVCLVEADQVSVFIRAHLLILRQ